MNSCKVPIILDGLIKLKFLYSFSKSTQISNFMKGRPVGAELFHADRRTDMTTVIAAFRNFLNAVSFLVFLQIQMISINIGSEEN